MENATLRKIEDENARINCNKRRRTCNNYQLIAPHSQRRRRRRRKVKGRGGYQGRQREREKVTAIGHRAEIEGRGQGSADPCAMQANSSRSTLSAQSSGTPSASTISSSQGKVSSGTKNKKSLTD